GPPYHGRRGVVHASAFRRHGAAQPACSYPGATKRGGSDGWSASRSADAPVRGRIGPDGEHSVCAQSGSHIARVETAVWRGVRTLSTAPLVLVAGRAVRCFDFLAYLARGPRGG